VCNFVVDRTNIEEKHFDLQNAHNDSIESGSYINESFTNDSFIKDSSEGDILSDNPMLGMLSREACIYIYTAVTVGTVVVALMRSVAFFNICMHASIRLHDSMFRRITRATMYFFNTNPSGKCWQSSVVLWLLLKYFSSEECTWTHCMFIYMQYPGWQILDQK
jgi:hypothetical protein